MTQDSDKGAFSADIPEDAIADALEAVERSEQAATPVAGPQRAGRRAVSERGACGGAAVDELETSRDGTDPAAVPIEVEGAAAAIPAGPADVSPFSNEAEKLRLELEMSQERARKVYSQLKDEHDRLLRSAADHDNYKKRVAREKDEILRYGNERLVKEILPAVDSLDRAIVAAEGGPLASGIQMTRRLLEDALGRFGVKGFSAKGEVFDPRVHEALMSVATAAHAPGTVVEEMQRGFFLHDRLIRPAAVVVAAAPPAASGETRPAEGDDEP
jgi:molecular chaperone GrpE